MKTRKSAKSLSFFLAAILTLPVILLPACQTENDKSQNDTTNPAGNTGAESTVSPTEDPYAKYNDDLGVYNFNGEEFKIQIYENINVNNRVDTEEENAESESFIYTLSPIRLR